MRKALLPTLAFLALAALAPPARAGSIDLTTLPPRERCQLTIYNSEDLTLARETRRITFKKGVNRIQFSWAGTLIDPTSIELKVKGKERQEDVQVIDATFPRARPDAVIWSVESQVDGEVECEVSYFTAGLSWAMDYTGVVDPAESRVRFDGFVTVTNRSGEDYPGAEVRLVVGVVNLVEKIADLARQLGETATLAKDGARYRELRRMALAGAMDKAGRAAADGHAVSEGDRDEKMVVKEGLSEYFLFSIDGREDVPNGWQKRMRAVKTERPVALEAVYRLRAYQYGPRPVKLLLWKNDAAHGLGGSPLPDGTIRLFRASGGGALSFLGAQQVRYIPIQQDVEVNVGPDDEVVMDTRPLSLERGDFAFRRENRLREVVTGWTETEMVIDRARNFRDRPVRIEVRRRFQGDVELTSPLGPRAEDAYTVEVKIEVAARGVMEIPYTIVRKMGENAKQSRVLVK